MNPNNHNQPNAHGAPAMLNQAPMAYFPGQLQPMQQQPAMQFAWPQWTHMMLNGQQWAQPALQGAVAQMPQLAQASSQTSAAEIAAAVAQVMRPMLQESNATPAGSDPRDERILVDALKKGHAEGLTTRQAIEKLHNVNNHTQASWKDYYLDNDKRFFQMIYGYLAMPSSLSARHNGASISGAAGPAHTRPQLPRRSALSSSSSPGKMSSDSPPSRQRNTGEQSKSSRSMLRKDRDCSETAKSSPMPTRSKRGDPVDEYHAETYIPPFSGSKKPKAPLRAFTDDSFKFTDEDKVFLIHYLRWRVRQGDVPTKSEVYEELAEHTHHSADAWKRHWQQNAELPDRILAQAQKQYAEDHLDSSSSSDEEEEEEEEEADEEGGSEDEEGGNEKSCAAPVVPRRRRRHGRVTMGVKVTEEDLRAMAKYKAERLQEWSSFDSKQGPWKDFAEMPGNRKRSWNAWYCAARDHADELERYLRECLDETPDADSSDEERTPPQQDAAGPSSPFSPRAPRQMTEPKVATPRKRPAESTDTPQAGVAPAPKRVKQDNSSAGRKRENIKDDKDDPVIVEIF